MQAAPQKLTVYASVEVHSCSQKAVELLGMGTKHLRKIPVNDDFTIDLHALNKPSQPTARQAIARSALLAMPATINTGAIDDLNVLADLCAKGKIFGSMWMAQSGRWLCLQRM